MHACFTTCIIAAPAKYSHLLLLMQTVETSMQTSNCNGQLEFIVNYTDVHVWGTTAKNKQVITKRNTVRLANHRLICMHTPTTNKSTDCDSIIKWWSK